MESLEQEGAFQVTWSQVMELTPREAFSACVQCLQSTLGAPWEEEEQKLWEWGG